MNGGTSTATGALGKLETEHPGPESESPIDLIVSRAKQLYSLPTVAMEVLKLTSNQNANVAQIKECIQRDPAMTVKILKSVNSPLFGLSGEVSDLNQALALLGIKPLKLLVLGFSLPKEMMQGIEAEVLAQYWQFSLTKAVAAREIASLQNRQYGDEAFIAGLLSELGALVLLQDLGDAYAKFINKVLHEQADLSEMEWSTLGFDHAILGCRLLQSWNLPESLVQTIRQGHPSSGTEFTELSPQAATLRLAHTLAEVLAHHRLDLMPQLLDLLATTSHQDKETVEHLVIDIQDKLHQLAGVLSVALPEGTHYSDIIVDAYQQLSTLAEEAAPPLAMSSREAHDRVVRSDEGQCLIDTMRHFVHRGGPVSTAPHAEKRPQGKSNLEPHDEPEPASPAAANIEVTANRDVLSEMSAAMQRCRDQRVDFSLALLQINDFEEFILVAGIEEVDVVHKVIEAIVTRLSDGNGRVVSCGDSAVAMLLEGHDRHQTVSVARQVTEMVGVWAQRRPYHDLALRGGVASTYVPPKSLPPQEIFQAARRCLLASTNGGGNVLKSIELL